MQHQASAASRTPARHASVRAEVVGSLLRPDFLLAARRRLESGEMGPPRFKEIEDRAVDEAIELQTSAGIDVITDGEQRRYAFFGHLVDSMAGFDKFGGWAIPFHDEKGEQLVFKRPVVVEKLRPRRNMAAEEFTYLRASTTVPAKVTMISAQQAAAYYDPENQRPPTRPATPISPTSSSSAGARSTSSCALAALTSRSTRRSTRLCSTPSCARDTGSAAATRRS